MFTGIVEEIGRITAISRGAQSLRLTISGNVIFSDMEIGCSIAVNGVCLTVTEFGNAHFTADVMAESVKMTTLHTLKVGDAVNLERAMAANGRFGGHMVAGHVDGIGHVVSRRAVDNSVVFRITAPQEVMEYVIYKGSITVDGASLTVSKRESSYFEISIIPHTLGQTILGKARPGTAVNLETDIAGRYIRHFMMLGNDAKGPSAANGSTGHSSATDSVANTATTTATDKKGAGITMDVLSRNGFI